MNGWARRVNGNVQFKERVLTEIGFDMICLCETFLRNDDDIHIDGYRCFKKNRSNIHDRARRGSGGVACLIREELLSVLEVSILDDSVDDILWIKLKVKESGLVICLCVCYLPPEGSFAADRRT